MLGCAMLIATLFAVLIDKSVRALCRLPQLTSVALGCEL